MNILVIDPSKPSRTMVNLVFSQIELELGVSFDFFEAVDFDSAASLLDKTKFDLVLCCQTLFEHSAKDFSPDRTPILLLSTVADRNKISASSSLIQKDYLLKPLTKTRILDKLSQIFPNSFARREAQFKT